MKRIVTFCALCALWGCRQVVEPSGEVIALSYSTSEQSKTDVLTSGDQISVFACMEGTEDCFLEAAKFIVGADGRSLDCGSPVYYPDPKQAVRFFACFPYHTGTFSVPTDQSTALALKQADLCWAAVGSTPVASAVPLEFTHQMARLLITTNTPTEKIVIPNAFSGGTLDIRTGVFTNTLKSDISTTGNELIVPVQPLARLVLTVSGVEYVFASTAPINLTEAQTTTISLTLNSTTKTATLSGSSTTNWVSSASEGNPTQAVSNILTLHWPSYLPQGTVPDKIAFTIGSTDYTVASGITHANQTFTVPFASSTLRYPYTISKIAFYRGVTPALPVYTNLLGRVIYKSGASTVGINLNSVKINGLWWATGSLVADGPNGCRIGAPSDCGLYFQFGSLIGWSGGADPDYNGTGMPTKAVATVKVKPLGLHPSFDPGAIWPEGGSTTTLNKSYFSITTAPYLTPGTNILNYVGPPTSGVGVDLTKTHLGLGRYAPTGVGDPCSYYLGGGWRMPLFSETAALFGLPVSLSVWTPLVGASVSYNSTTKMWRFTRDGAVLDFPAGQNRFSASVWNPTGGGDFNGNHSAGWSSTELHTRGLGEGAPNWFVSYNHPNSWIPSASHECSRNGGTPIRCVMTI